MTASSAAASAFATVAVYQFNERESFVILSVCFHNNLLYEVLI
jgi:hypothetical protein